MLSLIFWFLVLPPSLAFILGLLASAFQYQVQSEQNQGQNL
jgi:membrane protein required for beta-lactamase induction